MPSSTPQSATHAVISAILAKQDPDPSDLQAAGAALASEFYFAFCEVGEPHEGGGLAFMLTPVELWKTKGQTFGPMGDFEEDDDALSSTGEFMESLFSLDDLGDNGYGALTWIWAGAQRYMLDEADVKKALHSAGFQWDDKVQFAIDPQFSSTPPKSKFPFGF
jgi:hypothetical protein